VVVAKLIAANCSVAREATEIPAGVVWGNAPYECTRMIIMKTTIIIPSPRSIV
jgi:hypothetical protein